MDSLVIFKNTFVNTLRGSIDANLDKYLSDNVWTSEVSSAGNREMKTGVVPAEPLDLVLPEEENLKDIENAIRIHRILKHLSLLQARDPRLWTKLTHVDLWPYMRLRWPIEKYISDRDKASRFILRRYFIAQNQSRALLRNGIARLWWTAQLSYDPGRDNPYELTAILLSTLDITQQIVERGMGRADNIIKGFLEFLRIKGETLLTGGNRNRSRIRQIAKHLNMCGGVCILDLLSQLEVTELLNKELDRILKAESASNTEVYTK